MYRVLICAIAAGLALSPTSCGKESEESRPVEFLYFVQGPSGAQFEVVGEDDHADCLAEPTERIGPPFRSGGFGFQTSEATHLLDGTFRAPHFFVFENEVQPTRAVLRNLSDTPLTVLRLLGASFGSNLLTRHTIPAGACRSISNFSDADEAAGTAVPFDLANDYRIEVCSFARNTQLPRDFHCQDLAPRGTTDMTADGFPLRDIGTSFLSTVGDFTTSFLSRCLQVDATSQTECRTPATFYMNAPQDQISVAMTRLVNQVESVLQVDLYRGDKRVDSGLGTGDVTARKDI